MPSFIIRVSTPKRDHRWHFVRDIEENRINLTKDREKALRFVSRSEAMDLTKKLPSLRTNVIRITGPNEVKREPKARFTRPIDGWLPLENVMVMERKHQVRVGRLVQYGPVESVLAFSHLRGEQPGWVEESVPTNQLSKVVDGYNRKLRGESDRRAS